MCQIKSTTGRASRTPMKDNEEHRTAALFRQNSSAGISDIIA